jgi:hypothetical protein
MRIALRCQYEDFRLPIRQWRLGPLAMPEGTFARIRFVGYYLGPFLCLIGVIVGVRAVSPSWLMWALPLIVIWMYQLISLDQRSNLIGGRAMFQAYPEAHGDQTLELDEAGIVRQLPNLKQRFPWSSVCMMARTPRALLIGLINGNYLVVPLRAFADETQAREFGELVRRRIAENPRGSVN